MATRGGGGEADDIVIHRFVARSIDLGKILEETTLLAQVPKEERTDLGSFHFTTRTGRKKITRTV